MSRKIPLSNSSICTIVDDDMYDELSQWSWYLLPVGAMQYVARDVVDEDGSVKVVLMHKQIMYPSQPRRWSLPR